MEIIKTESWMISLPMFLISVGAGMLGAQLGRRAGVRDGSRLSYAISIIFALISLLLVAWVKRL